jgi:hypothetical protein
VFRLLALLAVVVATTAAPAPAFAAPAAAAVFTVYLSPTGSDGNDGLTAATAVRTLARAHQVLVAQRPTVDVEVRIAQGTYVAAQTSWSFYVPGHFVSFMPIDYEIGESRDGIAGLPVLRSNGSAGWWLTARLPGGHTGGDTNLRFYYLQVEGYSTGGLHINGGTQINAQGISVPSTTGANHNTLYGMVFQKLGSKHNASGFGYGAVDLVNSSDNFIRNNHFRNNENTGGDAGLIHGIYLAHWSKRNTIAANRFSFISGGPMRTRNDSNDNDIYANTFERTGTAAYSEWFCDAACVSANPGHGRECASHGNVFHDNAVVSSYSGGTLGTWTLTPPGIDLTGGAGCDNEAQKRLRTYGNT